MQSACNQPLLAHKERPNLLAGKIADVICTVGSARAPTPARGGSSSSVAGAERHVPAELLRRGMTHVMVWRGALPEDSLAGFWHHGILCQDGTSVIHYAGMDGVKTLSNARIMRTALEAFHSDPTRPVHTVVYDPALHARLYAPAEVEARAERKIGHAEYHLVKDNCESFARWCVTGREVSQQSTGAVLGAVMAGVCLVGGGGLAGAVLAAVVTAKCWDRRGNRSSGREPPPDDGDD
jgi:Lecithin retinol acyltransferase